MRKEKRWRYYCDFCKKGGCSGGSMAKHERGCTRNPTRKCGMCEAARMEQQPTPALLEALLAGGVDAVKQLAHGCPACVMAAIHAYRKEVPLVIDPHEGAEDYIEFNYASAAEAFWENVNHARACAGY